MAYSTFTLTGTFKTTDGAADPVTVAVIPSVPLLVDGATGGSILAGVVAQTFSSGVVSITSLPTLGGDILPASGWGYTVLVNTRSGQQQSRTIATPPAAGSSLDIKTLTSTPVPVALSDSGVGTSALDSLIAAKVNDAASLTRSALSAGNIDATVRKLNDDFADVNVLVLGDSTASQTGQFPDLLLSAVQALYPHRTLQKATWDNSGHSWGSFSQVGSSGSGANLIKFWQGAVTGTVCETVLNYWDGWVAAIQPDLVIVHHGHNYGKNAADGGQPDDATMDYVFRERYLRFIAEIKRSCPTTDVLLVSQNPYLTSGARTQMSNVRAHAVRQIAADLGCAYGPVLEAYLATGSPASYLQGDLLHPNTSGAFNGAQLASDKLLPLFRYKADHEVSARALSPLLVPANNLLLNGDFASFASPPTLTSWTASNTTLAKDTTNYESANAYSVKGTGTAAANCTMFQSLPIRRVRGQVITFAARFFIAAAQGSSQPGRVQITGDGGTVTTTSGTLTTVRDNWVWAFVTVRVPNAATFATASVIFGTAVGHECSVDRAIVTVGHMPRGLI